MRLKTIVVVGLILSSIQDTIAQWQMLYKIGASGHDSGRELIDENGNIYCYGDFEGACFMGINTLFDNGWGDMFLAKYDAQGNELWSVGFGGINGMNTNEFLGSAEIDTVNDFIYLNGCFYGTMTIGTLSLYSGGSLDVFLAKFDLDGNCIWLIKAGSAFDDYPSAVNLDQAGNIYWIGNLYSSGFVDTLSVAPGVFLAKVSPLGEILWVREFIQGGSISNLHIHGNDLYVLTYSNRDTTWIDTSFTYSPFSYPVNLIISKHNLFGDVQ